MNMYIWLGIAVFLFDFCTPFIPVVSLVFLVITIIKPAWFKKLVTEIYK